MEIKPDERLGLGPAAVHADRPEVIDPQAIRKFDLLPQEAFMLSRIEGYVTLSDLALMCGLETEAAAQMAARLVRLRVLARLDQVELRAKTLKIPLSEKSGSDLQTRLKAGAKSKSFRQRAKTRKMQMLRAQVSPTARRVEDAQEETSERGRTARHADASPDKASARRPRSRTARSAQAAAVNQDVENKELTRRRPAANSARRSRSQTVPIPSAAPKQQASAPWDMVVIDESQIDTDLAIPKERQIALLKMSAMLGQLSAHDLLQIAPGEDAAGIRKAFHQQSRWLHPDAYHGKDLGPYRDLLEKVFSRVRQAYQDLQRR